MAVFNREELSPSRETSRERSGRNKESKTKKTKAKGLREFTRLQHGETKTREKC